jgi:hypothetical protein
MARYRSKVVPDTVFNHLAVVKIPDITLHALDLWIDAVSN